MERCEYRYNKNEAKGKPGNYCIVDGKKCTHRETVDSCSVYAHFYSLLSEPLSSIAVERKSKDLGDIVINININL